MWQNQNINSNGSNGLVSRLAAEKKKTVMAACLVVVMVFMWLKILGGKTPQSAGAAMIAQDMSKKQLSSKSKISFVELPKIKGRNDVLTRDFFTIGGKHLGGTGEVNVLSGANIEEYIRRIAEKLKLQAIILGSNSQVFINDKLLTIGDELLIRDDVTGNIYECEITGIEENTVFIRCGEAEIQLKLAQAITSSG